MSTLTGPFGDARSFLQMIALPNCADYFREAKKPPVSVSNRELLSPPAA
jgi:hypothetical protein